ncbi:TonB-dependent receptor [Sphingomonas profundi]|uniref:TonB-dependent receptor n=1 Tax=Alterirhizorhabdus profundi TaxID=2681549 RepID=UPI0012E82F83|nr:TonB-dependent receptor [Sphingomonas profundi]
MTRFAPAALLALLLATTAQAEAPQADIVVTGNGLGAGAGDAAYDVTTIDRDRLASVASGRLEDVLRDAAGFQQFRRADSRSAHPTAQGATLRGLGGNASSRALILLDGVPQIDPFGGWVSFAAFDPRRLGLVRVTRGGGTGAYGPGALAGTIELMSAGPGELKPVSAGIAYGSRDSVDADAGLSGSLGGGFASLSAAYARGDGFTPIVKEDRGTADMPARYEQASLAARAVIPVGEDTELQAGSLLLLDRRTRGLAFTPNRNIGGDASLRLVGRGRWGWEALAYLQMRQFSSGFASVNAGRTLATATLDQYAVPATGAGGRIEVRPPLAEAIELRLGADTRITDGETRELFSFANARPTRGREAGGRNETYGAFAEATLTASDVLTLTGGARIDRWRIVDGRLVERPLSGAGAITNTRFADRAGWEPTGRAGIAWKPAGAVTVRGAGYLGWRLPTLNELYRPFRVGADLTQANPLLKPERLRGVDGGVDFRPLPAVRLSATLFYNRLDDAIANVTTSVSATGAATRVRRNLDAIVAKGAEVEAGLTYGAWSLTGSYAYVDARVRAEGQAAPLDGLRPAQTPKHQASATLAYGRADAFRASATMRYVSGQYEDDQNMRTLADALTVDATVSLPVRHGISVEARAENLGDRRIETAVSNGVYERAAPRTLWIGVRFGG